MEIRECILSDANDIYLLNKEEMGYDFSLEQTKEKLNKLLMSTQDRIFVAVINQHIVGYVHACDYDVIYMDHLKNIMGIAVSQQYQHRGIGKQLLEEVEKWAIKTGASGVRLVSSESRKGAHVFYQHCGYETTKKQLRFMKKFKKTG